MRDTLPRSRSGRDPARPAPGGHHWHRVPERLRELEPVTGLALAGHAVAVQATIADRRWEPLILAASAVLVLLSEAGLLGARSACAILTRGFAVLLLGFCLQAVRADNSGYFLLWFFVLVAVYPLVLRQAASRLLTVATPTAYLVLLALGAIDGRPAIALLRALTLAFIGVFVHKAARAYRDAVRQVARSEATAQEALATLQRALLPAEVTSQRDVAVAGRYRAAGIYDQIGGDWYDTIELPTGGLALVIGDVEGHDLTAASVMGLVRGAVRSYAMESHPPSILLERVNAFLVSADVDRLVTMAYVQLYPGDTVATVAVAGHPVPLVVPVDGGVPFGLPVTPGPLLGIEGARRWQERTILLPRDASLVLYTDGLLEVPRAPADQLERLMERARRVTGGSVPRLADTLIAAAPGYDDAAVLVAGVRPAGAIPAQRTFPAQPISAGIARTWIADLFELWQDSGTIGRDGAVADRLDTAQLLLTELVSNAVRHSDQTVKVRLEVAGERLRVEVSDTSERMPVMRRCEVAATEGRGLRLVEALASDWGVRLDDRGKVVWFELGIGTGVRGAPDGDDDVDEERLLAAFSEPE